MKQKLKTVGQIIDYLSRFPRDWKFTVTRSDEGGEVIPYLEGEGRHGEPLKEIRLTIKGD